MKAKTIFKYLGIRIGILLVLLSIMVLMVYLTNDPHKNCTEFDHRHNMGPGMGLFIGGLVITISWSAVLLFEGIVYFVKGKNNLGWITLSIILLLSILALAFI